LLLAGNRRSDSTDDLLRLQGSGGSGLEGDDTLHGGQGTDDGHGGAHIYGDTCISIEHQTGCEA